MTDKAPATGDEQSPKPDMPFGAIPITPDLSGIFYNLGEGWGVIADAYYKGATILSYDLPEDTEGSTDIIFPMMYLYRHFVELSLKDIHDLLSRVNGVSNFVVKKGHKFSVLFPYLERRLPSDVLAMVSTSGDEKQEWKTSDAIEGVRTCTEWLASFDDDSERFRYPVNRQGAKRKYPRLSDFGGPQSPTKLRELMAELETNLSRIYTSVAAAVDAQDFSE